VLSTVTGDWLQYDTSIPDLLATQLAAPVKFRQAVEAVAREADLLIEVGPGRVLTNLAAFTSVPVVSSDRLLEAVAAAWSSGADLDLDALFADRFFRPFDLEKRPAFIESPTERFRSAAAKPALSYEIANPAPRPEKEVTGTLRELVAKHVDLSLDLVLPTSKLLSDLHLSSITVARLLADAARAMGVPPLADPTSFANATIEEATAALEALRGTEATPSEPRLPDGVGNWLRAFRIDDVPFPCGARLKRPSESDWRVLGDWPEALTRFQDVPGAGIVAVLPNDDPYKCIDLLLQCRAVADGQRLVVVQQAPCGSGFARTLFIERPNVSVRIVNVPRLDTSYLENVVAEAEAHGSFCEATYGDDSVRREPRLAVAGVRRTETLPLGEGDVLFVTGGGKGIGFETALHIAKTTGARLVLAGRSHGDDELRTNFARLTAAGVRYEYLVLDVTKPLPRLDDVTAVLHAAGTNAPALLDALDEPAFRAALAPKIDGLRNVLSAVDRDSLKVLITLGSVIARTGMRGEAHYAFANEWLARRTEEFGIEHPQCKAICIEWSVWSGMGMGERLGTMDALRRQGITPVAPDEAVELTMQLASAPPASHVMACGRLGDPPTIRFADDPPPLYRFLEQQRLLIPGVELIADAELSLRNDPYLEDHAFGGEPLLPAVLGLEAMAQVAHTVSGSMPVRIENVELLQPVTLATIRVAALRTGDAVDVAVRTSSTQFRLDHFRARVIVGERAKRPRILLTEGEVELDPTSDLYETLLFHTGRFRGVRKYRRLTATECVAEIAPCDDSLFHRYLPPNLLLGDATIRDAAIHALQACVPQSTVLPQGIATVELFAPVEGETIVVAREIARHADGFVYDVDLAAPDGQLFERWHGLRLQVVARRERVDDLVPALWGPFLERELSVGVRVGEPEMAILHRHDGKPLVEQGHVSRSHDGALALTVTDEKPVGVDVQSVEGQPWDEIIAAQDHHLADVCIRLTGDQRPYANARIWSARESMKKLAGDALAPLVVDTCGSHRRVTFRSGPHRIDTFVMQGRVVAVAKERSA
jgi:enediyne polyketide synthase